MVTLPSMVASQRQTEGRWPGWEMEKSGSYFRSTFLRQISRVGDFRARWL